MKPVRVIPDPQYPGMWHLQWADGTRSVDMYNLTRANDILRNYDQYRANMRNGERMKGNKRGAGRSIKPTGKLSGELSG